MDKICFFQCFSLNCYKTVHVGDSHHKRMLAWCKCPLQSTSRLGGLHSAPGSGELGAEPGSGPGRYCRPEQNKNPGHMFTGLQLHHPATVRRHPTSRAPSPPRLPSTTFLETVEIVPGPIFNSSPRRDEGRRLRRTASLSAVLRG